MSAQHYAITSLVIECPRNCGRELEVVHDDAASELRHADTCRCQRNDFTASERVEIAERVDAAMRRPVHARPACPSYTALPSPYAFQIRAALGRLGYPHLDPALVEAWVRVDCPTLDHLNASAFDAQVKASAICTTITPLADSITLADAMGLVLITAGGLSR